MSIIEKEIDRRHALIKDNDEKIERAAALRAEADKLEAEIEAFDEGVLREEIKELESYLMPTEAETAEVPANSFGIGIV